MHINKITKEGNIEALDYDAHFEIINDEDDYLIALVIGDDDEGIVLTFDAKEFEEFRRTQFLPEHFARLENSLGSIGMAVPFSIQRLESAICALAEEGNILDHNLKKEGHFLQWLSVFFWCTEITAHIIGTLILFTQGRYYYGTHYACNRSNTETRNGCNRHPGRSRLITTEYSN